MEGGNRFQMPSPVSSSGERFPVVRTGVPPLQGNTLTGSNAGSCDREAAFGSKRSGNAEFICLRLLFPKGIKTKAFFVAATGKRIPGCPIFTAPEQILSCRKTPGRSPRTAMLSILTKERTYLMNTLAIVLIAAVCLAAAYLLYGRWLANKWGIDPAAKTPAQPTRTGRTTFRQKALPSSVTSFHPLQGAGPVTGAIQAAAFGWLPVLLWVLLGGIFFGAVTDFGALYASVKTTGKSIGLLIEKYIGVNSAESFSCCSAGYSPCWLSQHSPIW